MSKKQLRKLYHGIKLWHKTTGSLKYYIKSQQDHAVESVAPGDAIYFEAGKSRTWICVTDLAPSHPFRELYAKYIAYQDERDVFMKTPFGGR